MATSVTPGSPPSLPPYRPSVSNICLRCTTGTTGCQSPFRSPQPNDRSSATWYTPAGTLPPPYGPSPVTSSASPLALAEAGTLGRAAGYPIRAPPASALRHPAGFIFSVSAFLRPGSSRVFTWHASIACPCRAKVVLSLPAVHTVHTVHTVHRSNQQRRVRPGQRASTHSCLRCFGHRTPGARPSS